MDVAASGGPDDGLTANMGTGTPGVVSIMGIVDRAGFIEDGPFQVRIILTEEPKGGLTADKIIVKNGSAGSVVKGATYKGGHNEIEVVDRTITVDDATVTLPGYTIDKRDSELGPKMVTYYHTEAGAAAGVAVGDDDEDNGDTADNGTVANFPEATGRDNMYHSYIATITPTAGFDGDVTISIGAFEDNTLPVSKKYVPLTAQQRAAVTLTGAAENVRDARVMNESFTVRASSAGDTTSEKALATAAYKTRQRRGRH